MKDVLKEVGLTEIEANVYLALIKHGSSLAGKISSYTGIHRRTVYDAIERLIEKGLVTYIRTNNKKYFEAVDPKRLLGILKEKELSISKAIPELEKQFRFVKEKKETVFLRGKNVLQSIFNEQMETPGVVFYSGDSSILAEIFRKYLKKFEGVMKEKKILIKTITDIAGREKKDMLDIECCEFRFLKKWTPNKTVILGYGAKLVIISWSDEPIAILIKEKEISECFFNYFRILWGVGKR